MSQETGLRVKMSEELTSISKAEQALNIASTPEESKEVEAMAAAAKAWASELGDYNLQCDAWRIYALARRKTTELIKPHIRQSTQGRPLKKGDVGVTLLRDIDFTKKQWERRRKELEKVTLDDIQSYIAECKVKCIEPTLKGLMGEELKEEREQEIKALRELIENIKNRPFDGKYDVIVIDPPWPYGTKYDPSGRRAANPYPEMSLDELKGLNKKKIPAADNCVLWLWTTHKFMRHSFELLDAWEFRDVAILTWVKDRMGLGQWLRSQSEFCIMAVKGTPKINLTNQTTVINGPMREHSRKPDEFYDMVNDLCIGRKLDYFSTEKREGWDQYGIDPNKF